MNNSEYNAAKSLIINNTFTSIFSEAEYLFPDATANYLQKILAIVFQW
jgi:hypothetical protein